MLFINLFKESLSTNASTKTLKYVVKDAAFDEDLNKIANTIKFLAALRSASFVLGDEMYSVSEYNAPASIASMVSVGKIAINTIALDNQLFLYEASGWDDTKIMSPNEWNMFFVRYNESQGDRKLECKPLVFTQGCLMSELTLAKMSDGTTVRLGGTIDGEAVAAMEVVLPLTSNYFMSTVPFTNKELERWLYQ